MELSKNCKAIFSLEFTAFNLLFSVKFYETKFAVILNALKHLLLFDD